jgi:hypothetical protein
LRPTWPVTWATLATLKWRLGEIDQDLIEYLKQANKYGNTTLAVREAWLDIGLYLYLNKSPYTAQIMKGLREHFEFMIRDSHKSNSYAIKYSAINIIKRHNAQRIACKWLRTYDFDTTWHQQQLCKKQK